MPKVIIDGAFRDLSELDVSGIPVGTLVRTSDGDYYRLADSDAEILATPLAEDNDAVGAAKAATATNGYTIVSQPDVPRIVSITTTIPGGEPILPWDGGPITFRGLDEDGGALEESLTPASAGTVYGSELFASLFAEGVTKGAVGYSSKTVKCGYGPAPDDAETVAVLDQDSLRWLYANDEVLATALPRVWTFDTSDVGNVGRPVKGACTTLQDVIDANNFLLRAVVTALSDAGIATGDVLDGFLTTSER